MISNREMYFKNQLKLIEKEYNAKSIYSLNNIKFVKTYETEDFESDRVYKLLECYRVFAFIIKLTA